MFMAANRAVLTSHAPARVRIGAPSARAEASAHARSRPACSSRHAARQTRASASDGLAVMPLVIVAVVVAYVASARLTPTLATAAPAGKTSAPTGDLAAHDGSSAAAQPARDQEN